MGAELRGCSVTGALIVIGLVIWALWPTANKGGGADPQGPEQPQGPTPAEVLAPLISDTPRPGRFFRLYLNAPNAAGNDGVLAQALNAVAPGQGGNGNRRLAYLELMTRGWNADLYSVNHTTGGWGPAYNFGGINISAAWLPRNANAVQAIASGQMPTRTIGLDGSPLGGGSDFGLVWLPEIDEAALAQGAVVVKQREDGSDPFYPPRDLMELLA